jgi:cyclopropane fatty-acyl-phospholipid synthase-like methyltransferase
MKQTWPAPERNKQPILDVLSRVFPERASVLEIASGTGQHAAFFAAQQPGWTWQPSDHDAENLASIRAWVTESQLPNLRAPIRVDVLEADWGLSEAEPFDSIFSANMIHIAPWACCLGLIQGAARYLRSGGRCALYGPFMIAGKHTSESNATFDASLKARDAQWGVRDADQVIALCAEVDLRFIERVAMPANNQTLVFERR